MLDDIGSLAVIDNKNAPIFCIVASDFICGAGNSARGDIRPMLCRLCGKFTAHEIPEPEYFNSLELDLQPELASATNMVLYRSGEETEQECGLSCSPQTCAGFGLVLGTQENP